MTADNSPTETPRYISHDGKRFEFNDLVVVECLLGVPDEKRSAKAKVCDRRECINAAVAASKIKITIPTILAIKQRIDAGENSAVVCASYGVKKDSFWHALRRSKKRGVL